MIPSIFILSAPAGPSLWGPRQALTAAHCLWLDGEQVAHVWFTPSTRAQDGAAGQLEATFVVHPLFASATGDARWSSDLTWLNLTSDPVVPGLPACPFPPAEVLAASGAGGMEPGPAQRSELRTGPFQLRVAPSLSLGPGDSGAPWLNLAGTCYAAVHLGVSQGGRAIGVAG